MNASAAIRMFQGADGDKPEAQALILVYATSGELVPMDSWRVDPVARTITAAFAMGAASRWTVAGAVQWLALNREMADYELLAYDPDAGRDLPVNWHMITDGYQDAPAIALHTAVIEAVEADVDPKEMERDK